MPIASRLGPWLIGTVKETTGSAVGTVRNMGPSVAMQTFKRSYAGAVFNVAATDTIAVLPAGSQILSFNIDTLTAFTGSTAANLTIGDGTTADLYWASTDITAQGRLPNTGAAARLANWAGAATTASPAGAGVGVLDVRVIATLTPTVANVTLGLVQYTIIYAVRNPDGTYGVNA